MCSAGHVNVNVLMSQKDDRGFDVGPKRISSQWIAFGRSFNHNALSHAARKLLPTRASGMRQTNKTPSAPATNGRAIHIQSVKFASLVGAPLVVVVAK
jgi:hypothetical protein